MAILANNLGSEGAIDMVAEARETAVVLDTVFGLLYPNDQGFSP